MNPKKTLLLTAVLIASAAIYAQQNRYRCFNRKAVELNVKSMQYNHYFQLELKKENRDPQMSKLYREQAVHYQKLRDQEYEKCNKLPLCSQTFPTPSFSSQKACEEYLAPLEQKKQELEKKISEKRKSINELNAAHRYSDALPVMKDRNLLYAEKVCIENQIEACNCALFLSNDEVGEFYVDWEMFGIGEYVSLKIGENQISKGNERIDLTEGQNLGISGYMKNYQNYGKAGVSYSFSYVLNGQKTPILESLPSSGRFEANITSSRFNEGENVLFISLLNESDYEQLVDLNLGPFIVNISAEPVPATTFDLTGNGWGIKYLQPNIRSQTETVNNIIQSDHTPVGIGFRDQPADNMFFINGNVLGITNWEIQTYRDAANLQNGMNTYLNNGWFPMGISFTEQGGLNVLFVFCDFKATSWQLIESPQELGEVNNDVQPWVNQQYFPVGISIYAGMYYTLLVKTGDGTIARDWNIRGFENNQENFKSTINVSTENGLIPFGYLKEGNVVNVLFVGF